MIEQAIQIAKQHHQAGRLGEAEAVYRQILAQRPDHAEALHLLGVLASSTGRFDLAVEMIGRAVIANPSAADYCISLGNAWAAKGRCSEALLCFQKAISINPANAMAHYNSGVIEHDIGRLDEAAAAYARAIELDPKNASAHNNLGNVLKDQGLLDRAVQSFERAILLEPGNALFHSNKVWLLHYLPEYDAATIHREHCLWNERHAAALKQFTPKHQNAPDPARRLKVGYVSRDFHWHPVGRFLLPLLQFHDGAAFEVFCYSDDRIVDPMTSRLRIPGTTWRDTSGLSDEQVAQRVRDDQIDILVDLAGHTAQNRLRVFARKPAPVQVTWLGYPDTTGMSAMDGRITDRHADPPGMTESLHAERLERLPDTFLCFWPGEESIPVAAAPMLARGHVTFGSFNALAKINPTVVALWAEILGQSPAARLLIKCPAFSSRSARENLMKGFAGRGVAADRLDLRNSVPTHAEHLHFYDQVDIALDSFPYHGTTTTCEALWMGVPVVSLAGRTHVSRVGASILSNLRLSEFVAESAQEYVQIATNLAGDRARLSAIRSDLRQRMRASTLMDAPRFARNMGNAYRTFWRRWCEQHDGVESK